MNLLKKIGYSATLAFTIGVSVDSTWAQSSEQLDKYFEISKNLEIFSNIFKELNQNYVDPLEPGKMLKTGVGAMLMELDPYTNLITEADAEDYELQSTGKYSGIGVTTKVINDEIVISEVIENGPMQKAGIKAGDIVVSIDGQKLTAKDEGNLGLLMRGAPGTSLKMVVRNPISGAAESKTINRQEIKLNSVPHAALIGNNKDIAYVYLTQFTQNCSREVRMALDSLKKVQPNVKGIVLDLRNNPGGLLDEAVKLCNLFIDKDKLIVTTKGKDKLQDKALKTPGAAWDAQTPLAVLINQGSASASEIVSGTVQDYDRGVVIGTRSYGKGLVQNISNLGYNTRLKLTIAKYYTPSGRCIQAMDYSHRNSDGSVSSVPDSLKKPFKTSKGRVVYDGGGIDPDVKTDDGQLNAFCRTLVSDNYIFNYATKYYYAHSTIAQAADFDFTESDFSDFKQWLGQQKFTYKSSLTTALEQVKTQAEEAKTFDKISNEYNALLVKANEDSDKMLQQNKRTIMSLLSSEIVSRYHYQTGRVVNKMRYDDEDIKEALKVLEGAADYKKILKI